MIKQKFLPILAISSLLLASLLISSFTIHVTPLHRGTIGSYSQQLVSWNGSFQAAQPYHLDCFRRYYRFNKTQNSTHNQRDASNYFLNLS